jgi:cell division protein FtsI/penicillin-binding protein 2
VTPQMREPQLDYSRLAARDRNDPRVVQEALDARRDHEPVVDCSRVLVSRLLIIAAIFLAWVGAVEARLVYLQIFQRGELMAQAVRQQENREIVAAERGDIVDRHGSILAMSVRGFALEAARRLIPDPELTATRVCSVLDRCTEADRHDMVQLMRPASAKAARYVFLRRDLSDDEAQRVAALNEPGVRAVPVPRRYYPNQDTAAHALGFVNIDNKGQTGVELALERFVAGKPGKKIAQITGGRSRTRLATRVLEQPTAGARVELTLDRELQFLAERELRAAVTEHGAQGGTVVIMDPWSGDILALANAPTFNPNEPGESRPEARQNRAALHIYEPGSTFKVFTAAAALEAGRVKPSRVLDVSAGYIQFGNRRIYDVHRYGPLGFTDVIVKSSNVGAIKVGLELGPEVISRYVSRFGFGDVISRDIPHQRSGIVDRAMAKFGPSALASVAIGYQIGVTPLQMVAAVSSVANGGELVAPRLVKAIESNGTRVEIPRRVIRRTISQEVAIELTGILEQVIERGTAQSGRIEGYSIAGKTGTAAKLVNGRYSTTDYNASFVGFLPSRQPRVTILVVIDAPRRKGYYGGVVAAPLFKRIGEATLAYLGVPPNINPAPPVLVARHEPEPLAARSDHMSQPTAGRLPLQYTPAALTAVDDGPLREGPMPDLRGLGARDAIRMLALLGVEARISGDGFVTKQGIAPGSAVARGSRCPLVLTRDPPAGGADPATQP